jgi:hypothetical protein
MRFIALVWSAKPYVICNPDVSREPTYLFYCRHTGFGMFCPHIKIILVSGFLHCFLLPGTLYAHPLIFV